MGSGDLIRPADLLLGFVLHGLRAVAALKEEPSVKRPICVALFSTASVPWPH
jgi:hypothetical protein